ncbi:cullin family protein, partial [Entamoeba invadens IP1]
MTSTIFQLKKASAVKFVGVKNTGLPRESLDNKMKEVGECLVQIVNHEKPRLPLDFIYSDVLDICYAPNKETIEKMIGLVDTILNDLAKKTRAHLSLDESLENLNLNYLEFSKTLRLLKNLFIPFDRVSK